MARALLAQAVKPDYTDLEKMNYDKDINFHVHGEVQRPWGYEIRVAVFDDANEHVHSACLTWNGEKKRPDQGAVMQRVVETMAKYKNKRDNPEPEPVELKAIDEDALVKFLIDRGHLVKGQTLSDIEDKTPATVETPRWRVVWDFLNRPLWSG